MNKSRGRPKAYDPRKAIKLMREVFWDKGYAATSLDDLCAVTGLNRPSLYNGFGDKAEIYRKVIEDYMGMRRHIFVKVMCERASLRDNLERIYETVIMLASPETTQGRGCFMIGSALTECPRDRHVADRILLAMHELDHGYKWRLRQAQLDDQLSFAVDVDALATLLSATHSALSIRSRAGAPLEELRRFYRVIIDQVCA